MSKQGRDGFSAPMALPAIPEGGALSQLLEDRRSDEKDEAAVGPPSSSSSSSSRRGSVQSQNGDVSDMQTGGSGEAGYATPPVTRKSSEDQDMLRSPAPLQPETVAGLSDPDNTATGLSENPRPAKQPRQGLHSPPFFAAEVVQRSGTPSSGREPPAIRCIVGQEELNHEDDVPTLYFAEDEVEFLEDYDYVMEETKQSADLPEDGLHPDLCFPYDAAEPEFPEEQLMQLQALADQVEIARLERMEVLLSPETLREEAAVKELSTKFVRGWRKKQKDGASVWYLRSRLVAREHAWLESRDDLFSPASSGVTTKVLPVIWLQYVEQDWTLGVCDIADAFLTVNQQQPTVVNVATATGERIPYALGKVLPGQRDGSLLWHTDFTSWLYEVMEMTPCEVYPCILRTPGPNRVFIMLHVDDMMIAGPRSYIFGVLLPNLKKRYKVTMEFLDQPGDSFEFLKRVHYWLEPNALVIQFRSSHFERLAELTDVSGRVVKHTPHFPGLAEIDSSAELDPQMQTRFRSCVGILMYLAGDLPDCQFTIRALSQFLAHPTEMSWKAVRHLVQYLYPRSNRGLRLEAHEKGMGLFQPLGDLHPYTVEAYSDADWAANKLNRRSTTSGVLVLCGNMVYSASRVQRTVALSSAESEYQACVSVCCDGLLLAGIMSWMWGADVPVKLWLDNMACKAICLRSGAGKVRHLACRILWVQEKVKARQILPASVPTRINVADLGTKKLGRDRLDFLLCCVNVWDFDKQQRVGQELWDRYEAEEFQKRAIHMINAQHQYRTGNVRLVQGQNTEALRQALGGLLLGQLFQGSFADALSPESPITRAQDNMCLIEQSSAWSCNCDADFSISFLFMIFMLGMFTCAVMWYILQRSGIWKMQWQVREKKEAVTQTCLALPSAFGTIRIFAGAALNTGSDDSGVEDFSGGPDGELDFDIRDDEVENELRATTLFCLWRLGHDLDFSYGDELVFNEAAVDGRYVLSGDIQALAEEMIGRSVFARLRSV